MFYLFPVLFWPGFKIIVYGLTYFKRPIFLGLRRARRSRVPILTGSIDMPNLRPSPLKKSTIDPFEQPITYQHQSSDNPIIHGLNHIISALTSSASLIKLPTHLQITTITYPKNPTILTTTTTTACSKHMLHLQLTSKLPATTNLPNNIFIPSKLHPYPLHSN